LLLFTTVLVGVPIVLVCGGCLTLIGTAGKVAEKMGEERQAKTDKVKKLVMPHLRQHGITQLSESTVLVDVLGEPLLSGEGRDSEGRLHDVRVRLKVGQFGNTEQWEVRRITIDNSDVFDADA
jgi:hypothetical protein